MTIPATNATPSLTLNEIEKIANEEGISHARFVVDQSATQIGRSKCLEAYKLLARLEGLEDWS